VAEKATTRRAVRRTRARTDEVLAGSVGATPYAIGGG
jgi:hypothetical protein